MASYLIAVSKYTLAARVARALFALLLIFSSLLAVPVAAVSAATPTLATGKDDICARRGRRYQRRRLRAR